jgi:2-polyprenyl-3-methyl-5-hydroxy-6-metoxy-1,4-benzoquinol methylase
MSGPVDASLMQDVASAGTHLAFADRGYDVVAIDASEEMVRLARERVSDRVAVHLMRFQDVHWRNEFDGIWTCASLLHMPAASFADIAKRLAVALRPGGAWYVFQIWHWRARCRRPTVCRP